MAQKLTGTQLFTWVLTLVKSASHLAGLGDRSELRHVFHWVWL